ncbi:MAG: trypsin-like peptidase domain-containing protein [Candidatus Paceibacterota bacterium]|jgi:serine protease Do
MNNKKLITIIFSVLLVGILFGAAGSVKANVFGDIYNKYLKPVFNFEKTASPTTTPQTSQEIYSPTNDYEQAVIKAVENASPAVVSIIISKYVPVIEQCPYNPFSDLPPEFRQLLGGDQQFYTECQKGTQLQEVGGGSGFIVSSDGVIVTNKHVVADKNASYTVLTNDGKKYDAKVLFRNPNLDLAIVKISATGLKTIPLGTSTGLRLGQTTIAIGNALGEFRNTVSVGVVSGLARSITASSGGQSNEKLENLIQTDAAINAGNSGGPLLNLKGEVIGIDVAMVSGAQNIGFAVPIDQVKQSIESVLTNNNK